MRWPIEVLDYELGHALFDRTPKGMVLTDAGELFLDYARSALARLGEGRAALDALDGTGERDWGGKCCLRPRRMNMP